MSGSVAFVLHAHLPFVRHPEHARSLEETWLYEAITESYVPLLECVRRWQAEALPARITFSITPTLGMMLRDPLLRERYWEYLKSRIRLAENETHRTRFEGPLQTVAEFYLTRLEAVRAFYEGCDGDLVRCLRELKEAGRIEIIASAATHAVLPLLRTHPPSLRSQVLAGRDACEELFGTSPEGFWLPECAWASGMEEVLAEAGVRWFVTEAHGILHATPAPRFGLFAPVVVPRGLAAFGRDSTSARQVWSRDEGYPGDPWYRDFYRDIGFDLDLDYVQEYLPINGRRGFTGIKYHRITGKGVPKEVYNREAALARTREHARHFLECRQAQFARVEKLISHPIILCPFDAELFGHWWFEGPDFLDALVQKAQSALITLTTPSDYLRANPRHQAATPADSSWGEQGFWRVWLNEKNHWIAARLGFAQERMTRLSQASALRTPEGRNALRQAGRELLLAQASDWPFIIRTGTSPEYAKRRVKTHLLRFWKLCDQIESGTIDSEWLRNLEATDNIFPELNCDYWK